MAEVSAPLKPSNTRAVASSNEASSTSPDTGGGTGRTVLKSCACCAPAVLALPLRSVKAPMATRTLTVPTLFGGGVTSTRYFRSLTLISVPTVPPAATMSLFDRPVTGSLKLSRKLTGPVAASAVTLSSMVSVGATVSGPIGPPAATSPPSPPPQAATSMAAPSAHADKANFFVRCFIAGFLTRVEAKGASGERGVGPAAERLQRGPEQPPSRTGGPVLKAVSCEHR